MTPCREDWLERSDTLDAADRRALAEHLRECAACALELEAPLALDEAMRHPDMERIDRAVDAAMRVPIARAPQWKRPRTVALLAAAAVLIAFAAAAAIATRHHDAIPPPAPQPTATPTAPPTAAPTTADSAIPIEDLPSAAPATSEAPATAASLFERANRARVDGDLDGAVKLYRRVVTEFPSSNEAVVAHVSLGRLLFQRGDSQGALAEFDRYLSDPSRKDLREEALVGRARACNKLGRAGEERAAWQSLLHDFPDSMYSTQARERLEAIH
jgi:TolA-binding protein